MTNNNLYFLSVFLFFQNATAAFSNYNSILIGDQSAGMGGAYTAMAEDASSLTWYNPAGLAFLKGQSFSAAVGIYKKFDTHYGGEQDFAKASLEVNQGFFRAIPSSTGSVMRFEELLPKYTFAFSIVVPEYDTFKGDINNSAGDISSLNFTDESLWVGTGIGRQISADQSVGLSLYYTARLLTRSVVNRTSIGGEQIIFSEDKALTQNAIVAIVGYQIKYNPYLSFGASLRLPSLHIAGRGAYSSSYVDTSTSIPDPVNRPGLSSKSKIPKRLAFGVAWNATSKLILTSDVTMYAPESYSDFEDLDQAEYIQHQQVTNLALGAEYSFRDWLKLRSGLFTNFSSHPNPDPTKVQGQADRLDQLGFATNLAIASGKIQYTFGGYYVGGWGQSVQRMNQRHLVVNKSQQVFTMLVGTSFYF